MADQVYHLSGALKMPVEPVGDLVSKGWLPGTWVKYAASQPTLSPGAMAAVELSDGEGVLAGFLMYGPQHVQPVIQLSDMWSTDSIQRAGGDTRYDWSGVDAGGPMGFDGQGMLQRLGSRVVTMCLANEGMFRIYVFEVDDLAERTNPGTGAPLVYLPNDKLYVSDRGLLTSEQEGVGHVWTGYLVVRTGTDMEGNYLIIACGIA